MDRRDFIKGFPFAGLALPLVVKSLQDESISNGVGNPDLFAKVFSENVSDVLSEVTVLAKQPNQRA